MMHSSIDTMFQQSLFLMQDTTGSDKMQAVIASIFVFVLAIFIGFEIITKVPATLHTPLMSGSNAISGIIVVGAIICSFNDRLLAVAPVLGVIAIVLATVNVVGGFLVTDRMLKMFKKR